MPDERVGSAVSTDAGTIYGLLAVQAERTPGATAILDTEGRSLSYGELIAQIDRAILALRRQGLGAADRVAVVMPNGPEMAVAFLAIAACAVCAPLNPAYRAAEFDFYLHDLRAAALVVIAGDASPAIGVARARGIPVITLTALGGAEAGLFDLAGETGMPHRLSSPPMPDDTALVLHTSGTTARPKIVPLSQRNLCASALHIARWLNLGPGDRCLNVMPLFHIHGLVAAALASLASGACVVCTPGFYAPRFFEWLDSCAPTWYTAVPTMHQAIVRRAADQGSVIARRPLRFIRSSSSALAPAVLHDLERIFGAPVLEAYGMTEAAHQMASNPLPPRERKPGSVGLAAGPTVAILVGERISTEANEIGEVVVRGPNVTAGYEGDLDAAARAFVAGWLRTGDQGYLDAEGYLFLTGRLKELINRGGEKISPREIDEALLEHPAVAQALAFAAPHPTLGEEVAAAVVLVEGARSGERELQEHVAALLTDAKVPRRIVFLDELPKGATGKPQRIGLAERLGVGAIEPSGAESGSFVPPRTETETELLDIWRDVLRTGAIGVQDRFFALGGDSMLAAQLIALVRDRLDVDFSLLALFDEAGTVEGMAALVEARRRDTASPVQTTIIALNGTRAVAPLSFAQEQLWFLGLIAPESTAYNRALCIRIAGPLRIDRLQAALDAIVRRHEALRTHFPTEGGSPVQRILPAEPVSLRREDLAIRSDEDESAALMARVSLEVARGFDLSAGPPVRMLLLRLRDDLHALLLLSHHLISDGWSDGVFHRELAALYGGAVEAALPEVSVQPADHAEWERTRLRGEPLERLLTFWKARLEGAPTTLALPTDHRRPAVQSYRGGSVPVRLDAPRAAALSALARGVAATPFMALVAVFAALLARHADQDEVLIGTVTANRSHAGLERPIGFLANTLVLRVDCGGDPSFLDLLRRVRAMALDAYAHEDVPFGKLVEHLRPARSADRPPLVQVSIVLQPPLPPLTAAGVTFSTEDVHNGGAKDDLTLHLRPAGGGFEGWLEYNSALFEAETIDRVRRQLLTLVDGVVAEPERPVAWLPLLGDEERQRLLVEWNDTRVVYPPDRCAHELLRTRALETPDALALVGEGERLTYRELDRRAGAVARRLRRCGVGPETLVGLLADRSPDQIASLLGILQAGGAYLPLDPAYPPERIALLIEDAKPTVVLVERRLRDRLGACADPPALLDLDPASGEGWAGDAIPVGSVRPEHLAYVIYTSGSTGRPKGVEIEHRSLLNYALAGGRAFAIVPGDRVLQFASLSFDAAVEEIFAALAGGATLVLRPPDMLDSLPIFLERCETLGLTVLALPTAFWHELVDYLTRSGSALPESVRLVAIGGEAAQPERLRQWRELVPSRVRLVNAYGPTEATVATTMCELGGAADARDGHTVPIGRPIANAEVYVLDRRRQPVPVGMPGVLHIGGAGLARGYRGRPDLTAERFIPHPFSAAPGARLYDTGDLARYRPDGALEYVGRADGQLKIRGHRVEPGEVEAALLAQPGVRQAAVLARDDGAGGATAGGLRGAVAGGRAPGARRVARPAARAAPRRHGAGGLRGPGRAPALDQRQAGSGGAAGGGAGAGGRRAPSGGCDRVRAGESVGRTAGRGAGRRRRRLLRPGRALAAGGAPIRADRRAIRAPSAAGHPVRGGHRGPPRHPAARGGRAAAAGADPRWRRATRALLRPPLLRQPPALPAARRAPGPGAAGLRHPAAPAPRRAAGARPGRGHGARVRRRHPRPPALRPLQPVRLLERRPDRARDRPAPRGSARSSTARWTAPSGLGRRWAPAAASTPHACAPSRPAPGPPTPLAAPPGASARPRRPRASMRRAPPPTRSRRAPSGATPPRCARTSPRPTRARSPCSWPTTIRTPSAAGAPTPRAAWRGTASPATTSACSTPPRWPPAWPAASTPASAALRGGEDARASVAPRIIQASHNHPYAKPERRIDRRIAAEALHYTPGDGTARS